MKKFIVLLLLPVLIIACSSGPNLPTSLEFEIDKQEVNTKLDKIQLDVTINEKINEVTLIELGNHLRSEHKDIGRLYIFYRLKGEEENMPYAYTHFTPDLEYDIMSTTKEQETNNRDLSNFEGEIIGKWESKNAIPGGVLIYYEKNDSLFLRTIFPDGKYMDDEITESIVNGQKRLDHENLHGEYSIIEKNGNLGLYSPERKFDECQKF
jgi:hypothetical protein